MNKLNLFLLIVLIFFSCREDVERRSDFFVFDADERVFTAFAFMNAAGFDGEWRKAGMNPLRIDIRDSVRMKLEFDYIDKITKFHFGRSRGSWVGYADYALVTEGPPEFKLHYDSLTTENISGILENHEGLNKLLAEFYQKAGIKSLWKKYRPVLNETNYKYKPYADSALSHLVKFCRLIPDYFTKRARRIHFMVCPQMSYFTAQQNTINGDLYIISGPTDGKPGPAAFYHEALHEVINPITEKYKYHVDKSDWLFPLAKESGDLGYDTWESIVNESFVRTIDKILQGKLYGYDRDKIRETIKEEYNLGFILSMHIFGKMDDYLESDKTLEEYYPAIISSIDIINETERWKKYQLEN